MVVLFETKYKMKYYYIIIASLLFITIIDCKNKWMIPKLMTGGRKGPNQKGPAKRDRP